MSLRRYLGVVAMLGVLMHVAAIPRHNAIMLAGELDAADGRAALAALGIAANDSTRLICRAASDDVGDVPASPAKSNFCPICLGTAPLHAVPASHEFVTAPLVFVQIERVAYRDMRVAQLRLYRPPARGPPSHT